MNYLGSFPNHQEILGRHSQPEKKGFSIPCVSWRPRQGGLVCRKNLRSTHANLQQDISDKMYEVVVLNSHKFQYVCSSWGLESPDARGLDPAWHKLGITSEVRPSCPFLSLSSILAAFWLWSEHCSSMGYSMVVFCWLAMSKSHRANRPMTEPSK